MWAVMRVRPPAWTWAMLPCAVLFPAAAARADRLPLPAAEQAEVNRAIDEGVRYLKLSQLPNGTWALDGKHAAGYAAFPALTLLECGVPPDDPAVKQAAAFVRAAAPKMDETYELALSVLFLDRLGRPADERLIQTMALRLVAGQAVTGGWGYRCPVLTTSQSRELLLVLRRINPRPTPLEAGPGLDFPARGPDPAGRPAADPGPGLVGRPVAPGPDLAAGPTRTNPSPGLGAVARSPGETPSESPGLTLNLPSEAAPAFVGRLQSEDLLESPSSPRWARCIKSEEEPTPDPAPPARPAAPKPQPLAPPRVVVPAELRGLTVVQDLARVVPADPPERGAELASPTTDNSNTQFAVLALWVAQRHDVPMDRTLRRIADRFQTSQNADGSWGYHYLFGGGEPERPAMDCVGLLGLAVGHGLAANGRPAAAPVNDPKILNGFAAMNRSVGVPVGRTRDLPIVNLYLLWSIERVAVLYDLPTIANKDWYRWGAEVLVANQSGQGDWPDGGGYYGAKPPINTSLALLFLRRANLVSDLTKLLPFKPDELTESITNTVAPPVKEEPAAAGLVLTPEPPPAPAAIAGLTGRDTAPAPANVSAPPPVNDADLRARTGANDGGGRGWIVLVLILVALVLLAAAGGVLYFHFRNREKEIKGPKEAKRKKGGAKRVARLAADAPPARKATGTTRLHA